MNRLLIYSNSNSYSGRVRKRLTELLSGRGKSVCSIGEGACRNKAEADDGAASEFAEPDAIIVIGGDGTMLSAIRACRHFGKPFVGVDTGTLGFLNTIMPEHLEGIFDVLDTKKYTVVRYPVIAVKMTTINGAELSDYAFNEVIIRHYEPRLLHSKVYLNGSPFNYFTGDGFVISTPIGATGYAIWTGGAVVHTDLPAYQITPLAPNDNAVNRPMSASVILPASTKINIDVLSADRRKVAVSVDGMHSTDEYVEKVEMTLDLNDPVEIIRTENFDYFDLYRRKIIDKDIRRKLGN